MYPAVSIHLHSTQNLCYPKYIFVNPCYKEHIIKSNQFRCVSTHTLLTLHSNAELFKSFPLFKNFYLFLICIEIRLSCTYSLRNRFEIISRC
jgi:hypothetical protein